MKRTMALTLSLLMLLLLASCSGESGGGFSGVDHPAGANAAAGAAGNEAGGQAGGEPATGVSQPGASAPKPDSGALSQPATDLRTDAPAAGPLKAPGPAYSDIELEQGLCGLWHASPVVGSGFSARLYLDEGYSFVWLASEMDGMQRIRALSGDWQVAGGKLKLRATEEVRWEGGRLIPAYASWGTAEVIVDARTVVEELKEPLLLVWDVSEITTDREALDKKAVTLGGEKYWELYSPAGQNEIAEDLEALKTGGGSPSSAGLPEGESDWFSGVVREDSFYHDGQEKWIGYFYTDVGQAQLEALISGMDDYGDLGEEVETEIHLYSTNEDIKLSDYIGKRIVFHGEWFAAQTIYHRRNIVFAVQGIYGAGDASGVGRPAGDVTLGAPPSPEFAKPGTPCQFNESSFPYSFYQWAEEEDGGGKSCLMILIDPVNPDGAANGALYLPGYGYPTVGRNQYNIYIEWAKPGRPEDTVEIMFQEQSNRMTIFANAINGVRSASGADVVLMPVSVYKDDSPYDRYYVPLYAILEVIGGGEVFDVFHEGCTYIFSGDNIQSYTGFWETSDRGEPRADAMINGETQSIATEWTGLELRPDGTFTLSNRLYHEKEWVLTEGTGRYVFWGRMLLMLRETESCWRGADYAALAPDGPDKPDSPYVYSWYVEEWDGEYMLADGKALYAYMAERGDAAPRPGKAR